MAIFNKKRWKVDNDYETPVKVWEAVKPFLPKDKQIWLPFYCNGRAKEWFNKNDFNTIHDQDDFWHSNKGDCIIDNPPYMIKGMTLTKSKIIQRLKHINKPFMLLLPTTTLQTKYFKELFDKDIQLLIPPGKYNFLKDDLK